MKDLKALAILKKLQIDVKKDIKAEGIEVFGCIDTAIDEAIAELEALDNRSCENCKYDYIDIDDNCERCNRYYEDKFEIKASK